MYEIFASYFIVVDQKTFSSNKFSSTATGVSFLQSLQCKNTRSYFLSDWQNIDRITMDLSENKKGIEIPADEDMTVMSSRFKEKTEKKGGRKNPASKTQEQERQHKKMELEMVKEVKIPFSLFIKLIFCRCFPKPLKRKTLPTQTRDL